MSAQEYDVIVIGAGPVGENVADRAVQGGLTAVIVEAELVGGECSYWACMPSKALLRPAEALAAARAVAGSAEAVTGELDISAVLRRRTEFTHDWDDAGQVEWLASAGIDLVRGHGRISGVREVTVTAGDGTDVVLTARHAVAVCTGTSALVPDVPGLAEISPWTSREATSADHVPASLTVIGGGVVGVEMATLYAALGSQVTMVAPSGILPRMEPFVGERVTASLRDAGVVFAASRPASAHLGVEGRTVVLTDGTEITSDEVLVATGRRPRTSDLGLTALGVSGVSDDDWIPVDDTMLVPGTDWLYAVGDVNHRALLTHQGKYQARAAGDVIAARAHGRPVDGAAWGAHVATADHAAVPQVVFSHPPVGSVGQTAHEAEAAGVRTRVVDYDLGSVAGAATFADGYAGHARMIVDEDRGVVIGATLIGPGVEEMVHAATIAVVGEVPLARLWHAVPSYPTISEVWLRLLEAYGRP
ncbi:dihydrolipoyl dehydrogenase family protein [Microbacterium nymphoidis]|uniref:dihydrolipoyl dehydrogenase family protein n=1 Tax=Microbacterium nymphoidis TaxID=2898586 RepID=UPI001E49F93B|nr:NAD(P)/FAD-dependent oxidoreductase [Microbacterium nymphoidis]MCD2497679.1 NAD(P)/FAD-dependent oxidoreductase [Microbacterium nymphoidis]